MENPSEEWEEHSPPEEAGKVSWILNKGMGLGKKIVISGLVISSAPLVLPPLMVFSALGLALSVPFGFFFTTYVCTEKLMSKLLSTPDQLEYGTLSSSDHDEISGYPEEDMEFGEVIDFEEEEAKLMKDTRVCVEMRIELEDKGNEGFDQGEKLSEEENYEQGAVDRKEQEPTKDADEIVKEHGHEEDDKDMPKANVKPLGEVDMKMEEKREQENVGNLEGKKEPVMEESKDQKPIIDEGHIETAVEDDKLQQVKETRGVTEERDQRNVGNIKKMEKPSGSRKKKSFLKGGAVKKKDEEVPNKLKETKERRHEANNSSIPKVVKPVEETEGMQKGNTNVTHVDSIAEVKIPQEETRETANVGSAVEKEQKPKVGTEVMSKGRTDDSIVVAKTTTQDASAGLEPTPIYMDKKRADSVDHPISTGLTESPSRKGTTVPLNKAIYSEDKIWENISSMRTIVGYKVAPKATCMEELKALYIFTGVELPIAFKDSSDLVEINDKLRFLMSVVGVKYISVWFQNTAVVVL